MAMDRIENTFVDPTHRKAKFRVYLPGYPSLFEPKHRLDHKNQSNFVRNHTQVE
jgi:hypothetical protein